MFMIVSWYIYGIIMFENSFNFQVREKIFVFALNNNKKFTFNRRYKSCWFRTFIQTSAVWRSHSIYRFNGNKRHFFNHNDRAMRTRARSLRSTTIWTKPFNCGMCEKCTCIWPFRTRTFFTKLSDFSCDTFGRWYIEIALVIEFMFFRLHLSL